MKKKLPPIVFFGSGPVAAASLAFLSEHFEIEAVVTKPRAQGHRGAVPVLELADEKKFRTYTPQNKQELDELMNTITFTSPCGIVVDYGIIMSGQVIDSFPKGIVNSHFSLLPEWRGADPITFSILSGQSETGVSLMVIVEALDEGDLIAQETFDIPPRMTTPELTDALVALSNKMLVATLPRYITGEITPYPQATTGASYSRRLSKEDGILDWRKDAEVLEREVRGFLGWPQSKALLALSDNRSFEVIVTKAAVETSLVPAVGDVLIANNRLLVGTGTTAFEILRLKVPGKKEVAAADFIRGYLK